MKIAYVSFEYPPDSAVGGISTYVYQASNMMSKRGHLVEVFCSSPHRDVTEKIGSILVHRIKTGDRTAFPRLILEVFSKRHRAINFDILESPEYSGDGYYLKQEFGALPLVVKLHTPSYLIHEINNHYVSNFVKARYLAGGLLRGRLSKPFWKWKPVAIDIDYKIVMIADDIHTPSISLGDIVARQWKINRSSIKNVPYPFIPTTRFLEIPIKPTGQTVTFIGRLEVRKGIIAFLRSIPLILQSVPGARIVFVGKIVPAVIAGKTIAQHLEESLALCKERVDFREVTQDQIPDVLSNADVCVFPSIWENFPNVCLEAMSAGKAIVASKNGGMSEMLRDPDSGILIDPLQPGEIAEAVISLLHDPEKRNVLGRAARQSALTKYNADKIGALMESAYSHTITKSHLNAYSAV